MRKFEGLRRDLARLNESERHAIMSWLSRQNEMIYGADRIEEARPEYATPLPELMTLEEFIEFEQHSPIPYEFVNGIIRPVSAPGVAHCRVAQNIYRAIDPHLRKGPCEAFIAGGEVNLRLGEDRIVYKPDVFVACDKIVWDEQWIPNPRFVVEVLSPSTQLIDRKEKAVNYRRVPSMEEYVIASQKRAELIIYRRVAHWLPEIVSGEHAIAEFRALGVSVPLSVIYEDVSHDGTPSSDDD
jgi:Uma2 family endonuclease